MLTALPDRPAKRAFLLDCTGCHQFGTDVTYPQGRVRDASDWETVVARMVGFAGDGTGFPIISPKRGAAQTAGYLAQHLRRAPTAYDYGPVGKDADIPEYDYPYTQDLLHDVAVPVPSANPRAIDIDRDDNWWVLLGNPRRVARYDPATATWSSHAIGMYGHSIRPDTARRVWFNGHFTRDPVQVGYVDARSGAIRMFDIPTPPELSALGPIPYGLRVADDGTVWGTDLRGNCIYALDPDDGSVRTWTLPITHAGPRRPDVDARGRLWIPAYAANMLLRLNPGAERFEQYPLPIRDALPYVVRVDRARARVWVATGGADAVLLFDPQTTRFTVYPLPTRGALVRHMAIDERTGDVWAPYGASPGIPRKLRDSVCGNGREGERGRERLALRARMRLNPGLFATFLAFTPLARAHGQADQALPPVLNAIGRYHRSIGTMSTEAQRYFDQGVVLAYGFNSSESAKAFRATIRLDPTRPMAYWGLAFAHSPTLDIKHHPVRDSIAHAAVREAVARLAAATDVERGLIRAFETRFPSDGGKPATDSAYARAMAELWRRYPDDAEVGTLYAEALMLLSPRIYWTADTLPRPDTPTIVEVLDAVVATAPDHPGAHHLRIHLFEASREPERALESADRLGGLAPAVGHLVHMPSHIYFRVGRYGDAAAANYAAWRADTMLFRLIGSDLAGVSAFGYHLHSLHFLWMALQMDGRREEALTVADSLAAKLPEHAVDASNYYQSWVVAPQLVRARFAMWDEILAQPRPPANRVYQTAIDRYVRGAAYAATSRLSEAERELSGLDSAYRALPASTTVAPVNSGKRLLEAATHKLRGRIAARRGATEGAVEHLRRAIDLLDEEGRMDPPPWYLPARELLGAILLDGDRAVEAERVFREDLARHPNNGWSLHGLAVSLRRQGRDVEAAETAARFRAAWARAEAGPNIWR